MRREQVIGGIKAAGKDGKRMKVSPPAFRDGDEVVLAKGTYEGTHGEFLHLRKDPNWADIQEPNGSIRSHPVAWLALVPPVKAST